MAITTTPTPRGQAIEMPSSIRGKYRFTTPIFGGPVFAFPQYGYTSLNLAELTEQQAERLLSLGWAGIERIEEKTLRVSTPSSGKD